MCKQNDWYQWRQLESSLISFTPVFLAVNLAPNDYMAATDMSMNFIYDHWCSANVNEGQCSTQILRKFVLDQINLLNFIELNWCSVTVNDLQWRTPTTQDQNCKKNSQPCFPTYCNSNFYSPFVYNQNLLHTKSFTGKLCSLFTQKFCLLVMATLLFDLHVNRNNRFVHLDNMRHGNASRALPGWLTGLCCHGLLVCPIVLNHATIHSVQPQWSWRCCHCTRVLCW